MHLLACQVRVTIDDSDLYFCVRVAFFVLLINSRICRKKYETTTLMTHSCRENTYERTTKYDTSL